MNLLKWMTLLVVSAGLTGCVNPRLDIARVSVDMEMQRHKTYRELAVRYVKALQSGNAERAVAMMSPKTIQLMGRDELKTLLRESWIPAFKNSSIEWDQGVGGTIDVSYDVGLDLSGKIQPMNKRFYITILNENNKLNVANIRSTLKPLQRKE